MSLQERYRRLLDAAVLVGLRSKNFIVVMGVERARDLSALLLVDDAEQRYAGVYGLHNLRWILFDPNRPNGVASPDAGEPHALVLSLVFDGNLDEVLHGLLEAAGERVREILSHCFGFDENADVLSFLKAREAKSGYFFRDLGPLLIPEPGEESSKQSLNLEPSPDPTRADIVDAFAMQRRFERFYAEHAHLATAEIRRAFNEQFRDAGFPLPLLPFERRRSDEESWVRTMMDVSRKLQDRAARRSADRVVRRGAHAKGRSLIEGTFEVVDVAEEYRQGLFAKPETYRVQLRPSNSASRSGPDRERDARGLALRVSIPDGSEVVAKSAGYLDALEPGKQDFVLMSTPVFPAPDLRTFAMWFATIQRDGGLEKWGALAALALRPGGLRQAWLFYRSTTPCMSHPLEVDFHSTTPYSFGPRHVAKYAVEPVHPEQFARVADAADPDAISANLKASLAFRDLELKLFVYLLPTHPLPVGFASLGDVIEDATIDWRALRAKKVHVASLHVPQQDPTTAERREAAEAMDFNPWHALAEHRPLGSLNRARWKAYEASQRYRAPRP